MGSQLVAVRSLLIGGVTTALVTAGMPDVEATFAYKAGLKKRERVYTQNASFTHQPASLRAVKTFRDEVGEFEVSVWVEGVGKSPEWTSGRAAAIGLVVEEWVAIHANWEGRLPGLKSVKVQGSGSLDEVFNDKGSLAQLILPITYDARLT